MVDPQLTIVGYQPTMPGLLALSIATRWEVTKEVDVERLARQSPEVLNCLRSDLWLHRRATDRAQAASLADRSCEFYRPKSRHWCQDQWVLYLEKVNQAPIRPHHAPPHQRPAEAPPSTCRISPVTNAVLSRYRAALTISCVSPIRPMGCKPERNSRISGECIGVMITPGEIAFTRIPRPAYSIARERVTALRPPLVRAASPAESDAIGCSAIAAVMLTM